MNGRSRRSPVGRRYRDRSSSTERPRTRTYDDHSESYASDYSDDFEPDTRSKAEIPPRRRRPSPRRKTDPYSTDQSSTSHLHSVSSKKPTGTGRATYSNRRRPKQGWRSRSTSKSDQPRPRPDTITSRLLSAKQRRVNEIQNELADTEHRLESVLKENKLLKTVQHRQDKALRKFQDVESDLPRLISQNFEDQKVLKTRLKKAQEGERVLEEKLRENNDEMQKMEKTLRKLKKVVYDKNLGERSELARQLTNTENDLTVAERKMKELEKKLELTSSSFSRQIKSERQKHKETKQKLDALVEDYQSVVAKLKEKERALGVSNIYALRTKEGSFVKSPRKAMDVSTSATQTNLALTTVSETKRTETKRTDTPVLAKSEKANRQQNMPTDPETVVTSSWEHSTSAASNKPESQRKNAPVTLNGLHSVANHSESPREKDTLFLTAKFQSNSPSPSNSLVEDSIDFGKSGRSHDQELSVASPLRSNLETTEKPDAFAEAKQRRKQEKEKEKLAEEQKKKAALLANLREIENNDSDASPLSPLLGPIQVADSAPLTTEKSSLKSNSFISNPKAKSDLVKTLLGGTDPDPVVENLHLGLPSNRKKSPEKPEKEMSFGSYAPSVGATQASRKPRASEPHDKTTSSDSDNDEPLFDLDSGKQTNKKSDLLSQLFGDQPKNDNNPNSNTLASKMGESVTPRAKPVHSGYPWEKNVVTSTQLNGTASHPPSKVKTGLAVKASAPIQEDDIEELAL